jgi:hypothetical protein
MPTPPTPDPLGAAGSTTEHRNSPSGATDRSSSSTRPARRGRPPGTVALTEDVAQTILSFIRAGNFDYVAAEAAGVSARTFRDWMARAEETHPTRAPTPKLRRFAQDVRQAKAQARAGAEIRVYQEQPAQWLKWAARSMPDREGWTDPGPEQAQAGLTAEEWIDAVNRGQRDPEDAIRALQNGTLEDRIAGCPDPHCPCPHHKRRDLS